MGEEYLEIAKEIMTKCIKIEEEKGKIKRHSLIFRINNTRLVKLTEEKLCRIIYKGHGIAIREDKITSDTKLVDENPNNKKNKKSSSFIFLKTDKLPLKLNFELNVVWNPGWLKLEFYTDAILNEFTVLTINSDKKRRATSWEYGLRDMLLYIEDFNDPYKEKVI